MGLTKDYLLEIQQHCADELFGQEAVEWAIYSGWVKLTGNLQSDLVTIMGTPGQPETGLYDKIIVAYQRIANEHGRALAESYEASGLLAEIMRPIPPMAFAGAASQPQPQLVSV